MEVAAAKQLLLTMPPRDPNSPSTSASSPSPAASPSSRNQPHPLPSPPLPPRVIDTAPFPTTFVQADTASFKQVVQMLTGASDTPPPSSSSHRHAKNNHHHHAGGQPVAPPCCRPKKPAFKLYERRSGLKNLRTTIAPLAMAAGPSPRKKKAPVPLSPSVLDFPSLALGSPVTPLLADPFNRSPASTASPGEQEEEAAALQRAAIARNGFFLHPSPRSAEPPLLLPLFPVTSPRMASSSSATASQ